VEKKALAFSLISFMSSSSFPPRAGELLLTLVNVAEVLPLSAVEVGVLVMSPLGTLEATPPPTR